VAASSEVSIAMSDLREAAQQALELRRLADKFSEGWHDGIKIDASDIILLAEVADALEQPATDKCPTCGSDCNERDELEKADREIERLRAREVQRQRGGNRT